jgi:hypothetical protein
MIWALVAVYVLSTVFPLRWLILHFEDKMQRALDRRSSKYSAKSKWYEMPNPLFAVVFGTLLYPVVGVLALYWWLAFPKGRKTKYQKEKEQAAREQELKAQAREVLQWLPGSGPLALESGRTLTMEDLEELTRVLNDQMLGGRS